MRYLVWVIRINRRQYHYTRKWNLWDLAFGGRQERKKENSLDKSMRTPLNSRTSFTDESGGKGDSLAKRVFIPLLLHFSYFSRNHLFPAYHFFNSNSREQFLTTILFHLHINLRCCVLSFSSFLPTQCRQQIKIIQVCFKWFFHFLCHRKIFHTIGKYLYKSIIYESDWESSKMVKSRWRAKCNHLTMLLYQEHRI
jgi:hypothetical protein